jgi:REP element-mobilizing transposase RayT
VRRGIPSLRSRRFLRELRTSLRDACERQGFRVVHYSVQHDHLHLLVESAGKEALGRGMKAISARVARAVQRTFGLAGAILHGRYHLRILRTPPEVRSALAYVSSTRANTGRSAAARPSVSTRPPRAATSTAGGRRSEGGARRSHLGERDSLPLQMRRTAPSGPRSRGRTPGCWRSAGAATASSIRQKSRAGGNGEPGSRSHAARRGEPPRFLWRLV